MELNREPGDIKAIVTAVSSNSSLPALKTNNKHLMPLANKPMIFYAIEKVVSLGITDIGVVIGENEKNIQKAVGDGSSFGARVEYIKQEGEGFGIPLAIVASRDFLGESPFILYLGDNIVADDLTPMLDYFVKVMPRCLLALNYTKDAYRFGVPAFDKRGRITKVEERPINPASSYAVCGVYFYSPQIHRALDNISASKRGVYEISDLHTNLANMEGGIHQVKVDKWWKDRGGASDLLEGNRLALSMIGKKDEAHSFEGSVRIEGDVFIDRSAKIGGLSLIRGPVVIGQGCLIYDSYIGPNTSVGSRSEIRGAKIENSIICSAATILTSRPHNK